MDSTKTQVIKSGILKKIKPNRKRNQYFALWKCSEKNEVQHRIDQFDSESKFNSNPSRPKKSFLFGKCLCLYKRTEEKLKNAFTLVGTNDTWTIGAASEQERNEWIQMLKELVPSRPEPYNYAWDVTITKYEYHDKPAAVSAPKLSGNHRICLTDVAAVILKMGDEKPTLQFPLACLRRIGFSENSDYIMLEAGRKSDVGPAKFWLKLENAEVASTVHRLMMDLCQQCSKKMTERTRGTSRSKSETSETGSYSVGGSGASGTTRSMSYQREISTNSNYTTSDSLDFDMTCSSGSVYQHELYSDVTMGASSDTDQYVPMSACNGRTLHGSPLNTTRRQRLSNSESGVPSEADSYVSMSPQASSLDSRADPSVLSRSISPGPPMEPSDYTMMGPASYHPLRGSSGALSMSPPERPTPVLVSRRSLSRQESSDQAENERMMSRAYSVGAYATPRRREEALASSLEKKLAVPNSSSVPMLLGLQKKSSGASSPSDESCRSRTDSGGPEMRAAVAAGKTETGVHSERARPDIAGIHASAIGESAQERCRSSSFGQYLKRPSRVADPFQRTNSFSHVVRRSPPPPVSASSNTLHTPRVSPSARQPYDKPRRELQPDTYMEMEFAPKASSGDEMRSRSGSASSFRSPSGSCSSASHRSRSSSSASQMNRAAGASHEKLKDASAGDPGSKLSKSRPTLQPIHDYVNVDLGSTANSGFFTSSPAASQNNHGPVITAPQPPTLEPLPPTPEPDFLTQRFSTNYLLMALGETSPVPTESIQEEEESQFQLPFQHEPIQGLHRNLSYQSSSSSSSNDAYVEFSPGSVQQNADADTRSITTMFFEPLLEEESFDSLSVTMMDATSDRKSSNSSDGSHTLSPRLKLAPSMVKQRHHSEHLGDPGIELILTGSMRHNLSEPNFELMHQAAVEGDRDQALRRHGSSVAASSGEHPRVAADPTLLVASRDLRVPKYSRPRLHRTISSGSSPGSSTMSLQTAGGVRVSSPSTVDNKLRHLSGPADNQPRSVSRQNSLHAESVNYSQLDFDTRPPTAEDSSAMRRVSSSSEFEKPTEYAAIDFSGTANKVLVAPLKK